MIQTCFKWYFVKAYRFENTILDSNRFIGCMERIEGKLRLQLN